MKSEDREHLEQNLKMITLDIELEKAKYQMEHFKYQRRYWFAAIVVGIAAIFVNYLNG